MSRLKSIEGLFAGRHFDWEIIILCVRWYLRYKLSLRDLVAMMAERGLHPAHTTILRSRAAVCSRVREALASIGTQSWQILADGRDLLESARKMGLPLLRSRQGRQHSGLSPESQPGYRGSQSLLP